jgi:hypothetical protein
LIPQLMPAYENPRGVFTLVPPSRGDGLQAIEASVLVPAVH